VVIIKDQKQKQEDRKNSDKGMFEETDPAEDSQGGTACQKTTENGYQN